MASVAEVTAKLSADVRGFTQGMKKAEKSLKDVNQASSKTAKQSGVDWGNVNKQVGKGVLVAGAAITAMAAKGLKDFASFEKGMKEVYTLMPGISKDAMGKMENDVKALSKEMAVLPDDVVPALYQALSAGVPPGNVMEFMKVASKAAIGGITTLETAVDGITSVVNAYGVENMEAAKASDIMFTTVRLGKTTMEELSRALFQVTPVAASLGIGFEDVGAAMAALTSQGVPTRVAATQIRQALVELGKQGTIASDKFKELSGQTFTDFIDSGGDMKQAFDIMKAGADDMGVGVGDLFGSVEAGMGVIALTSDTGAAAFGKAMGEMQDSAGATEAAFDTMDEGVSRTMDHIKADMAVEFINLGEALVPAFEALVPLMQALIPLFADLAPLIVFVFEGLAELATTMHGIISPASAAERGMQRLNAQLLVFDQRVKDGADPINVAADLIGHLARNYDLTAESLSELQDATGLTNDEMAEAVGIVNDNRKAYGLMSDTMGVTDEVAAAMGAAVGKTADEWREAMQASQGLDAALKQLYYESQRVITGNEHLGEGAAAAAWALRQEEDAANDADEALEGLIGTMKSMTDPVFAAIDAIENFNQVLADADANGVRTNEEMLAIAKATVDMQTAFDALNPENVTSMLALLSTSLGISVADARALLVELGILDGKTVEFTIHGIWDLDNLVLPTGVTPATETGGGIPVFHGGGLVGGQQGTDEVLAKLLPGEGVIDRETMRNGFSGSGGDTYINVAGSVLSQRDLVSAIREAVSQDRRRG